VERYVGWGCMLNCYMLSSLPCFYAFCWSAIPTSCYTFNVFDSCKHNVCHNITHYYFYTHNKKALILVWWMPESVLPQALLLHLCPAACTRYYQSFHEDCKRQLSGTKEKQRKSQRKVPEVPKKIRKEIKKQASF